MGPVRQLSPGEILWEIGDPGSFIVRLDSGQLEVVQPGPHGQDAVLSRLQPSEIVGEMSCLENRPHSARIRAGAAGASVSVMHRPQFLEWLQQDPLRWQQLFASQSQRIRHLSQRLSHIGFHSVKQRLIHFLLEQPETSVAITQQQLGEYLAATRESVSKALKTLSQRNLIRTGRGSIHILDRARLMEETDP